MIDDAARVSRPRMLPHAACMQPGSDSDVSRGSRTPVRFVLKTYKIQKRTFNPSQPIFRPPAMRPSTCLTVLATLVALTPCAAQTFKWRFTDAPAADTLPECGTLPITLDAAAAKPPFYLVAYAVGGTPTTSPLGAAPAWVVNQPAGMPLSYIHTRAIH